jgi:hypothetical protein
MSMLKSASTQDLFQPAVRNIQLLIIAQLLRQAPFMRDLDELCEWLARALVRHYHVQVAQFWVAPGERAAPSSLMLRALECQNERLVGPVLANEQVVAVAEHVMETRSDILLRDASGIFSVHQAAVLKRYGLNYCSGYYVQNVAPPGVPGMAVLLFWGQVPPEKSLRDIRRILEQAALLTQKYALQLPPAWPTMVPAPPITPPLGSYPAGK